MSEKCDNEGKSDTKENVGVPAEACESVGGILAFSHTLVLPLKFWPRKMETCMKYVPSSPGKISRKKARI